MREKLAPSSPGIQNLPYDEDETEYQDYTQNRSGPPRGNDLPDEHESFHEYESHHKLHQTPFYRRRRVWMVCGIATVIFLAIFIPIMIKFIIPAIAQLMMNNSEMKVVQLNMTEPCETSMTVSVLASVGGIPKLFSASMEFTEAVVVSWNGIEIGSMTLGTVHVSKGKGNILQTTTFKILNTTAFGDFAKVMLSADGFAWTMHSKATVSALGQNIKNLKIDKRLDMNGLSNFANLQILGFDLPSDAPDGKGALVSIQASVDNPSPIGMTLGTITLDMCFQTAYLGRVVAKNVTLIGGQSMALNLEGTLLKQTDPVHAQELSLLMSNYLANIPTLATGKGVSVFPDGVNSVSWLTNAITSTSLTVPLKAVQPLDVIKNIAINDMNLVMFQAQPWAPMVNSNSISADFKIPFNISINVTELGNTTFKMVWQGKPFAELSTAVWNTTASNMPMNKVVFSVPPSPMLISDQGAFTDFLSAMTLKDSVALEVTGSAQGVAITLLGTVRLTVPLKTTLTLKGINFAEAHPAVTDIKVVGGTTSAVQISGNVHLMNPSIFSVTLGAIALQVKSAVNGTEGYVGVAAIDNLILRPGENIAPATISFKPLDKDFGNAFLGAFVAGESFVSRIYGDENTSPIASLVPTLKTLTMSTTIPGMVPKPRIITGGNGLPTLGAILGSRIIPLTVTAANPLDTTLWIQQVTTSVFWEGNYFGGVDKVQAVFEVKPNITTTSPQLNLQCPQGYQFALFLVTQFIPKNLQVLTGGIVIIDMDAILDVNVGGPAGVGYPSSIHYVQNKIPAMLKIEYTFAGMFRRSMGQLEHIVGSEIAEMDKRRQGPVRRVFVPRVPNTAVAVVTPEQREALLAMGDREIYTNLEELLGEQAPPREAGMEHVAWMERALRALYPEYQ
ncbi:hypothetical protein BG003_008003 [Podila horticola]|nr:hypothetical protein BG003_008003 [Podila horticola]